MARYVSSVPSSRGGSAEAASASTVGWSNRRCCARYPIRYPAGTVTAPESAASSPRRIRNRVVFPDPLRPTTPTRSPGATWNEAPSNRVCLP